MSVLKDDGTIWTVGNISAAGVSISNNGDGLNTEACNDSEFCQTIKPLNLYDDTTNSYHWYSTNWNKTEIIKPKYVSHLHGATIAVDQDGFLRIASANDAKEWGKLGYYSQVAFPRVIDGESTIRTSEEFSGVSDETLVTSTTPKYYGNTTNARIPGEFTLVDEVHVANPVYKFEGADAKPDVGKNGEYLDGLYNPTNVNIGPAFNGEYSLNKDGSASTEGDGVVLKYKIFKYSTQMELADLQGQLVSEGTAAMSETYNLDLSNLEPGEYYITSYREHTTNSAGGQTAGEVYVSDSVMEVFKIPSEPIINVDKVAVVTNDDLSLESTINYAYQRECTEVEANCSNQDKWLTNQVYFDGNIQSFYGENLVSAITNGNVHNGNGGTMSKPVKQKVSASSSDAGVYQVTYSVFAFTGGFFTSENQALVIDDGSIGYTDGDQYAIKSNNIAIRSEEVSGFTDTVFKSSADLAAWKIMDGVVTKVNYQYSLTDANGDAIVKEAEGDYSIPVTITMGGEVVMTKNVTVSVVGDDVEIGDTHAIYALSKVIMLEDVVVGTDGNMTNADALELVEARAWEIATGKTVSVYVNDFMSSPVKKAIGSYYYKLDVNEDNSVNKMVFVNVKDKQTVQDGTHFLRADGFQIGVNTYASASSLTNEMILSEDFTASRAWNNSVYYLDISVVDRSALDSAITNKKPGVYPITLGVDAYPSLQKIVHVIVTDDYTTVGTDYTIRAENFVIDISKVDDYLNDPSLVISNDSGPSSNAQIFNNNDSTDKPTLLVEDPLPLEKKGGPYTVKLTGPDGEYVSVGVIVKDKYTVVGDEYGVRAESFTVTLAQAMATGFKVDDYAKPQAFTTSGTSANYTKSPATDVKVTEGGVYYITYTSNDDASVKTTIAMTVTDESTMVGTDYAIYGKNLTLSSTTAQTLIDAGDVPTAISSSTYANVYAWDLFAGDKSTTYKFDSTSSDTLSAEGGAYKFVYYVENEPTTKREVIVTVVDNNTAAGSKYAIRAVDVNTTVAALETALAGETTMSQHIETQSQVEAWSKADGSDAKYAPTTNPDDVVQVKAGVYYITYAVTDESTTKVTIAVNVTDDDTVIDGDSWITAGDFEIHLDDYSSYFDGSDAAKLKIKTAGSMSAYKATAGSDNTELDLTYNHDSVLEEVGTYTMEVYVDGTNLKRTVSVLIKDDFTSTDSTYAIRANNFDWELEEYDNLDLAAIKDKAGIKVWELESGDDAAYSINRTAVTNKPGTYPIVITVDNSTHSKTIYVTIKSVNVTTGADYSIYSVDFKVKLSDLTAEDKEGDNLTDAYILGEGASGAYAWANGTSTEVDVNVADKSGVSLKIGTFPIKFGISEDETLFRTTNVVFYDDDTVPIKDGDIYALRANDFTLKVSDFGANNSIDNAKLEAGSGAYTWNIATGEEGGLSYDKTGLLAKVGVYEIVISSSSAAEVDQTLEKRVKVLVVDDNTEVGTDFAIRANSYQVHINNLEIGTDGYVTLADIIDTDAANAKAWSTTTPNVTSNVVYATGSGKVSKAIGTYPVTLAVEDETTTTKTIYVTVTDDNTAVGTNYAISASGFSVALEDVTPVDGKITLADIISKSGATAWKMDGTNKDAEITGTDLPAKVGTYSVTLSVKDEPSTQKVITIIVTDKDTTVGPKYAIYAKDYTIDIGDVSKVDYHKDVIVWDKNDPNATPLAKTEYQVTGQVLAKVGSYKITYTAGATGAKTTHSIYITVKDNNTVIVGDYAIYAKDMVIDYTLYDSKAATNAQLINTAKTEYGLRAWNITNNTDVTVSVDRTALTKDYGLFPVEFYVEIDTVKVVTNGVNVLINDAYTDEGSEYAIRANNFFININDITDAKLSLADISAAANANVSVWKLDGSDLAEGEGTVVIADGSEDVIAKIGVYKVILNVEDDTEATRTIYVSVYNEYTDWDKSDPKYVIHAVDKRVHIDDFDALAANLIVGFEAQFWNADTGEVYSTAEISKNTVPAVGSGKVGTYFIVGYLGSEATNDFISHTTTLVVYDDETIDGNEYSIRADNIVLKESEIKELSDTEIIALSKAYAWNTTDATNVTSTLTVTNDEYDHTTAAVGDRFAVTLTVTEDSLPVSKNLHIIIVDEDTVYNTDYALRAKGFTIKLSDLQADTFSFKNAATGNVYAWDLDTNAEVTFTPTFSKTGITSVSDIKTTGSYKVTFTVDNDPTVKKTITMVVIDDDTVISVDNKYGLTAYPIVKALSEYGSLKPVIDSKAHAFNVETGTPVTGKLSYRNETYVKQPGIYSVDIVLGVTPELVKPITVELTDEDTALGTDYSLYADDVVVKMSDIIVVDGKMSITQVIDLSNSKIWHRDSTEEIDEHTALTVTNLENIIVDKFGTYHVTIQSNEETGLKRDIMVSVISDDTVVDEEYALTAGDFEIHIDNFDELKDEANIIEYSGANAIKAWKLETNENAKVKVGTDTSIPENAKYGTYYAEIEIDEEGATLKKRIYITVVDNPEYTEYDDKYGIVAFDRVIHVDDYDANEDYKTLTNLYAWAVADNTDVTADIVVIEDNVQAKVGSYAVKYQHKDKTGPIKTVWITVEDDNTTVYKDVAINGKDIVIDIADYDTMFTGVDSTTNTNIIAASEATIWDKDGVFDNTLKLVSDYSAVKKAVGTYPVILASNKDATRTHNIRVIVTDSKIETNDNYVIAANNFTIHIDDFASLETNAVSLAGAFVWRNDVFAADYDANVDNTSAAEFVSTTAVAELGSYDIVFRSVKDTTLSITVRVTVIDDTVTVDEEYAIKAEDFSIDSSVAASFGAQDILDRVTADGGKAWAISDNSAATLTVVSNGIVFEGETSKLGSYDVVLGVAEGDTTKTIRVHVVDSHVSLGTEYALHAEDFQIDITDFEGETPNYVELANAYAWRLSDNENVTVTYDIGTVVAVVSPPVYTMTFKVEIDGVTIEQREVNVTVIDENTYIGTDYSIRAQDFTIHIDNIGELQTQFLSKKYADAKAWENVSGTEVTPIAIDSIDNVLAAIGTYDVTLSIDETLEAGVERAIKVTVIDDHTLISRPDRTHRLRAESFVIDLTVPGHEFEDDGAVTATEILVGSKARLWNDDTVLTDSIVVSHSIQQVAGAYQVKLSYTVDGESVTKNITVTVKDKDTTLGDVYALRAENFKVSSEVAKTITNDYILTTSKAKASTWNQDDGTTGTAVVVGAHGVKSTPGVYKVNLSVAQDSSVSKDIYVTVYENESQVTGDGQYLLVAKDFTVDLTASQELPANQSEMNVYGMVDVISTLDGSSNTTLKGAVVSTPTNMTDYIDGLYDVTYKVSSGTEADATYTVQALVINERTTIVTIDGTNYALFADNMVVDRTDAAYNSTLYNSSAKIVKYADAKVVNTETYTKNDTYTAGLRAVPNNLSILDAGTHKIDFGLTIDTVKYTVSANAYIIDEDSTVGTGNDADIVINARNFSINAEDLSSLTTTNVFDSQYANASAFDKGTAQTVTLNVNTTELNYIKTQTRGVFPLTFTAGEGTTKVIYVTVNDGKGALTGDSKYLLYANDFTVDLTQAGTTLPSTKDEIISLASPEVTKTEDGTKYTTPAQLTSLTIDPNDLSSYSEGLYDVEYSYPSDDTTKEDAVFTGKALIIDTTTTTGNISDDEDIYAIFAENIVVDRTAADYSESSYSGASNILSHANAYIVNTTTLTIATDLVLTPSLTNFSSLNAGVHELTLTVNGETLAKTIKVMIIDEEASGVDETSGDVVNAYNMTITLEEAQALDLAGAITEGNATAFNKNSKEEISPITVDTTELTAINELQKSAVLKLTFKAGSATKQVTVVVTDNNGVLTGDGEYLLSAENFIIDLRNNDTLPTTVEEIRVAASGSVVATGDGVVDYSKLKATPSSLAGYGAGLYSITLSYPSDDTDKEDAVLTIKVIVIEEGDGSGSVDGIDYVIISAENFTIDGSADRTDYDTTAELMVHSDVHVLNADTFEEVQLSVLSDPTSFADHSRGYYDLVFSLEENADINTTIKVLVAETIVVEANPRYHVFANDYKYDVATAKTVDSATIMSDIEAVAVNDLTYEEYPTKVDVNQLAQINKGIVGVYPLTVDAVTALNGVTTTSTITVYDDINSITEDGAFMLTANNFTIDLRAGETLPTNVSELRAAAGAKVLNTENGQEATTEEYTKLSASPESLVGYSAGMYDVTFTYPSTTGRAATVTVKVAIIDEDNVTQEIAGENHVIFANDILIDKTDANYDASKYNNSSALATSAGATVVNLVDYTTSSTLLAEVTTNPTTFESTPGGTYDITYNLVTYGVTTTAKVYVIDSTSTVDETTGVVINADNIRISSLTARFISEEEILELANAKAFNKDTLEEVDITVGSLSAIHSGVSAVYPLTLSVGEVTKTINVTVYYDEGAITGDSKYLLSAQGFVVDLTKGETAPSTMDEILTLASAKVVSTDDSTDVIFDATQTTFDSSDFTLSISDLSGYPDGLYPITITYANETAPATFVINAIIVDNDTGTGSYIGQTTYLTAQNFVVDKRTGSGYSDEDYDSSTELSSKKNANVQYIFSEFHDLVMPIPRYVAEPTTLANVDSGVKEIVFFTTKGGDITTTSKALIIDDETIIDSNGYAIDAHKFMISSENAKLLTDESAINLSSAVAFNINTKDTYDVAFVDSTQLDKIRTGVRGVYPLTLEPDAADATAQITVYVTVYEEATDVTGDGKHLLNGVDFIVDLTNNDSLPSTKAEMITAANIELIDTTTGQKVTMVDARLTINPYNLTGYSDGLYSINVSYTNAMGDAYIEVMVLVIDEDTTQVTTPDGTFVIAANNIIIDKLDDGYDSTDYDTTAELVALSNAMVVNKDTFEIHSSSTLTSNPTSFADATVGTYDVTFTADLNGTPLATTSKVFVIDEETGVDRESDPNAAINAENFSILLSEVSSLDLAGVVSSSNAYAINLTTSVGMDVVIKDATTNTYDLAKLKSVTTPGVYKMILVASGTKAEKEIFVTVYENEDTLTDDELFLLTANDFVVDLTAGGELPTNVTEFVEAADAAITDTATGVAKTDYADLVVNPETLAGATTGIYDVVFTFTNSDNDGSTATKTVKAVVIGETSVVDGDIVLDANNFDILIDNVGSLDYDTVMLEENSNASAFDKVTYEVFAGVGNLDVDATQLALIQNTTDTGVYPLTITVTDKGVEKIIYVTVTGDDAVITGEGDYLLKGNNFTVDLTTDAAPSNRTEVLSEAGVELISTLDGENSVLDNVVVSPESLEGYSAGVYDVVFTHEDTTLTVKAAIIDDSSEVGTTDNVVVSATGFEVDENTTLSATDAINEAGANAFDKVTYESLDVVVDATQLDAINNGGVGVYPLTFSVDGSDTAKVVYVTVTGDNGVLTGDGAYLLQAENYIIDLTAGHTLPTSVNDMIVPGSIKVTSTVDGSDADITKLVALPDSLVGKGDGIYPIELSYPSDDTTKEDAVLTINIVVIDDSTTEVSVDGTTYVIVASDILMDKTSDSYKASDYNNSDSLVNLANAVMVNKETLEIDTTKKVVSNPTAVDTYEAGIYDISFGYGASTTVSKLFVIDQTSTVGTTDDVVINASNFDVVSGTTLDLASVITESGANAFDKGTLTELDIVIVNQTELTLINSGETGVYPLTLGVTGSDTEKVIYVTVTDDDSIITNNGKHLLKANDFNVDLTQEEAPSSRQDMLDAASVQLISTEDGSPASLDTIVISPKSLVGYKPGVYEVTYSNGADKLVVTASIIDETSVIGTDDIVVSGKGFTIDAEDAKTLTDTAALDEASASVFDIVTHEVFTPEVISGMAAINVGETGVYPLVIGTSGSSTTKTVYVTVINGNGVLTGDGEYLLQANSYIIDLTAGGVLPTSVDDMIVPGSIKVTSTTDGSTADITKLVAEPDSLVGKGDGIYPITLSYPSDDTTKPDAVYVINIVVIDDTSTTVIIDGVEYVIVASDILMDKTSDSYDVSNYNNSESLVDMANAVMVNKDTHSIDDTKLIVADPSAVDSYTAGIYDVKFSYEEHSTVSKLFVIDSTSTVGTTDDVVINANGFDIESGTTLDLDSVIAESGANAFDKESLEELDVMLKDESELDVINSGETGVYPITLGVEGSDTEKVIYVTVTGDDAIIVGDGELLLSGNDFTVDLTTEDAPSTREEMLDAAGVELTNTSNGQPESLDDITVSPESLEGYGAGVHEVTFTHGDDELTVTVAIIDETSVVGVDDNIVVSGNGFRIDSETAMTLTDDSATTRAEATVFDKETHEVFTPEVISGMAAINTGVTGVYPLEIGVSGSNTTKTVYVTVYTDDDVLGNDTLLEANDFELDVNSLGNLTVQDIIDGSDAKATDITNGNDLPVNVSDEDLEMLKNAEEGFYTITVSTTNPETGEVLEKEITVSIVSENTEIDSNNDVYLNASDGEIVYDGNTEITDQDLIDAATAKAWTSDGVDLTGAISVTTNVDLSNIGDATEIEVTFTVIENGVEVTNTVIITVNHITLNHNTAFVNINDLENANYVDVFQLVVYEGGTETSSEEYHPSNAIFTSNGKPLSELGVGVHKIEIDVNGVKSTEMLVIFDDNTIFNDDRSKALFIDSDYIKIKSEVAKGLTYEDVLVMSNARGYDLVSFEQVPVELVNKNIFTEINKGIVGTYDVKVKVNPEATIVVEVVDPNLNKTGMVNYMLYTLLLIFVAFVIRKFSIKKM